MKALCLMGHIPSSPALKDKTLVNGTGVIAQAVVLLSFNLSFFCQFNVHIIRNVYSLFCFLGFVPFLKIASIEFDRKQAEREGEMTCNKVPLPESNQGRCDYTAWVVTTQLPKRSTNVYSNLFLFFPQVNIHHFNSAACSIDHHTCIHCLYTHAPHPTPWGTQPLSQSTPASELGPPIEVCTQPCHSSRQCMFLLWVEQLHYSFHIPNSYPMLYSQLSVSLSLFCPAFSAPNPFSILIIFII